MRSRQPAACRGCGRRSSDCQQQKQKQWRQRWQQARVIFGRGHPPDGAECQGVGLACCGGHTCGCRVALERGCGWLIYLFIDSLHAIQCGCPIIISRSSWIVVLECTQLDCSPTASDGSFSISHLRAPSCGDVCALASPASTPPSAVILPPRRPCPPCRCAWASASSATSPTVASCSWVTSCGGERTVARRAPTTHKAGGVRDSVAATQVADTRAAATQGMVISAAETVWTADMWGNERLFSKCYHHTPV